MLRLLPDQVTNHQVTNATARGCVASRSTVARASALARAPAPAAAAVAPPEFSDFFVMDELDELEVSATTQVATRASLRRRDVATGGATPAPPAPQPRRKKKRRAVSPDSALRIAAAQQEQEDKENTRRFDGRHTLHLHRKGGG